MRNKYLLSAGMLGLAGLLTPAAASAADLEATTGYTEYYGGAPVSDSALDQQTGGFAWSNISSIHTRGYAASAENGTLGAQAIVGQGNDHGGGGVAAMALVVSPDAATYTALATWETSITNNTGGAVDYSFLFHVYGPKLETSGNTANFASAGLTLYLNGDLIYDASALLDGSSLSYSPLFTLDPNNSADNYYQFADFDLALPLGTIGAGDSFTLTYYMYANATGYFNADGSNTYAFAYIGDPFDENQGPYTASFLTSPANGNVVPEPATWAMLIAGFGLVGTAVRRRRPATA